MGQRFLRRRRAHRLALRACIALVAAAAAPLLATSPSQASATAPPSPVDILNRRDLDAPFLDAVGLCVPAVLDGRVDAALERAAAGEWKEARLALDLAREALGETPESGAALDVLAAGFDAREAKNRKERAAAETRLQALVQASAPAQQACLRIERARLLILLDRTTEAAADLARALRQAGGESAWEIARQSGIRFLQAEILYRSGRRFDAHLAYRKIARDENARLALAARLRLTDLSFDAALVDPLSLEYESLLPRATAFGASKDAWSLRAAEAALDAGDPTRALRWLERAIKVEPDRDARDVADIRRADLEVLLDDPLAARKRLASLATRRSGDPIGALAAVRAVDLGVFDGAPEAALALLVQTVDQARNGLRRYALGILLREVVARDALDEAMAVATRLAYEGADPAVVPGYGAMLDRLLARAVEDSADGCDQSLRTLGGRYGILIERASSSAPFARLGLCFEALELPWLAVPVYRAIGRRFGEEGAASVALALARSALATGDVALARHMADAALAEIDDGARPNVAGWRAILAEADFREGRAASGAERARAVLDAVGIGLQRPSLVLAFARSLGGRSAAGDANFLAQRLPGWLAEADAGPESLARVRLLEAGLLAAHVLRRADASAASFALYRAVAKRAPEGPVKSSARFWLGLARQVDGEGERAWGAVVDESLGAPWASVAEFEARYESLRDAYAGILR